MIRICQIIDSNLIQFQPQPAKRGSGQVSLRDIDKLEKITKELSDINKSGGTTTVQQTTDDIERLREYTQQMRDQVDDDPKEGKDS